MIKDILWGFVPPLLIFTALMITLVSLDMRQCTETGLQYGLKTSYSVGSCYLGLKDGTHIKDTQYYIVGDLND